jgi:hypothetical protein
MKGATAMPDPDQDETLDPDKDKNARPGQAPRVGKRQLPPTDKNTKEALTAARTAIAEAEKTAQYAGDVKDAKTKNDALQFAHAAKKAAETAQTRANVAVTAGIKAETAKEPGRGEVVALVREALQKANAAQTIADVAMKLANAKAS